MLLRDQPGESYISGKITTAHNIAIATVSPRKLLTKCLNLESGTKNHENKRLKTGISNNCFNSLFRFYSDNTPLP